MRTNETYLLESPIEKKIVYEIISFTIQEVMVVPFNKAIIYIVLNTLSEMCVDTRLLSMEGDAYNQWGGDDEYLINWIREQLK